MKKSGIVILSFLFMSIFLSLPLSAALKRIKVKSQTRDGSTKEIQLYSDYYALVVGVGEYHKGWPPLPNPVNDAREVAAMLKAMNWTVDLLENPDGKTLRSTLNRLVASEGRKKERAILFWYSGHGYTIGEADGTKLGYLIPVDAPDPEKDLSGFMDQAVSMRQIETVSKQILSKHVLMIFDSCFSGAIFQMVRAKPSPYIEEKVSFPTREFITAGNEDEQVPDRSVFKEAFIQGLRDGFADLNRDSYVTGEELGAYLQEQVINYSRKAQHPQFGRINNPKLDKGDFVFVKRETDELALARQEIKRLEQEKRQLKKEMESLKLKHSVKTGGGGMSLSVESDVTGAKVFVNKREVGKTPLRGIPVSPGEHRVRVEKDGYEPYVKRFRLESGQSISLSIDLNQKGLQKGRLFVKTEPKGASVRVLNIKDRFFQGMELKTGEYHVEVTADGYKKSKKWVKVDPGPHNTLSVKLEQAPAPQVAAAAAPSQVRSKPEQVPAIVPKVKTVTSPQISSKPEQPPARAPKKAVAAVSKATSTDTSPDVTPRPRLAILPWKLLGSARGWNFLAIDALKKAINETRIFPSLLSFYDLGNTLNAKRIDKNIMNDSIATDLWARDSSTPNIDLFIKLGHQLKADAVFTSYIHVLPADPDRGRITVFVIDVKTKKVYKIGRSTDDYDLNGFDLYYRASKKVLARYRTSSMQ